ITLRCYCTDSQEAEKASKGSGTKRRTSLARRDLEAIGAQQAARTSLGGLAVHGEYLAVHDGGLVAVGVLLEPVRTAGQVADQTGHQRRDRFRVEDGDVRSVPGGQH